MGPPWWVTSAAWFNRGSRGRRGEREGVREGRVTQRHVGVRLASVSQLQGLL